MPLSEASKQQFLSCTEDFVSLVRIEQGSGERIFRLPLYKTEREKEIESLSTNLRVLHRKLSDASLTEQDVVGFKKSIDRYISCQFGRSTSNFSSKKTDSVSDFNAQKVKLPQIEIKANLASSAGLLDRSISLGQSVILEINSASQDSEVISSSLNELSTNVSPTQVPISGTASSVKTTNIQDLKTIQSEDVLAQRSGSSTITTRAKEAIVANNPLSHSRSQPGQPPIPSAGEVQQSPPPPPPLIAEQIPASLYPNIFQSPQEVSSVSSTRQRSSSAPQSRSSSPAESASQSVTPNSPLVPVPPPPLRATQRSVHNHANLNQDIVQPTQGVSSVPPTRKRSPSAPQSSSSSQSVPPFSIQRRKSFSDMSNAQAVPNTISPSTISDNLATATQPSRPSSTAATVPQIPLEELLRMCDDINITKRWVEKHNSSERNAATDHETFYNDFQNKLKNEAIARLQEQTAALGFQATGNSAANKAHNAIEELGKKIATLQSKIQEETGNELPSKKTVWAAFRRDVSGKGKKLSEQEKQLADMLLALDQAQALVKNSEKSRDLANVYTQATSSDKDEQLLLLRKAYTELYSVVTDIDPYLDANRTAPAANVTMIESQKDLRKGQTLIVRNVPDRVALADTVKDTMRLHRDHSSGPSPTRVNEASLVGNESTSAIFRRVALDPEKDIIQYTETLASGTRVYSETSLNKGREPVVTDRSVIHDSDKWANSPTWAADARENARRQAEALLTNYNGQTIVIRQVVASKDPERDIKELHMLYAAILELSAKKTSSSYPKIDVKVDGFIPPVLKKSGFMNRQNSESLVSAYLKDHLGTGGGYTRNSAQDEMAKQMEALRKHEPDAKTQGVGLNEKGKVIKPETEAKEQVDEDDGSVFRVPLN
jgi:hypothetical protein